jgi:hypothetical protein
MMGRRPYPGLNRKEYKEKLLTTLVQINSNDLPEGWSDESRNVVNSLLQRKEENRLGNKGAESVKSHPWFKDVDWEGILKQTVVPPFVPRSVKHLYLLL